MYKHKKRYKRRKRAAFMLTVFILAISLSVFVLYEARIRPIIVRVGSARAQSVATSTINDEINRIIVTEGVNYSNLTILERDAQNRISAVCANAAEINRLKAAVALGVQEKMRKIDEMVLKIPLGTLLSDGFLTGYGPRVPVRLTSIGRAEVDIEDSFHEAGINQTRHEIHLSVKAKISVLIPGRAGEAEIHTTIPVAQAVIVGEVPQSFTSVTGANGEPQDNVLNMLN